MSKPTEAAWQALKCFCGYLVGLRRMIFPLQVADTGSCGRAHGHGVGWVPWDEEGHSDGCAILGAHPIKIWSSTQSSVALISGGAEFNGVVRGAGVGLGYHSFPRELGIHVGLRVWTDSSAAIGICSRQERLMGPAKLFEMEYRGGRAASAPKTRVTEGTQTTLVEGV